MCSSAEHHAVKLVVKVKPVQPTEEEILTKYKDDCDDIDYHSYLTFDEFFEKIDFKPIIYFHTFNEEFSRAILKKQFVEKVRKKEREKETERRRRRRR